ncbi:MAG: hypothetical protein WBM11_12015 [Terriglobales bacterium]
MSIVLHKVEYQRLNARQKENYNFLKLSAVLADYGYTTMRLSDDWQGADFIAQHIDTGQFLKVQLKSRLAFYKKYQDKELYIAFCNEGDWYLYPHDELLELVLTGKKNVCGTKSWDEDGGYSFPNLSVEMRRLLKPYKIST